MPELQILDFAAARRLAAIVASSDDAIVSKDLNGVVASWNEAAERMFGFTADEAIGRSITIIIPDDRLFEEDDVLRRIRRGEAVEHFETIRRRKDGTLIPISVTISPIRDDAGNVIGASKIARDISERKHAEESLARAERLRADLHRRLLFLVSASASLVGTPDREQVFEALLALAQELIVCDGHVLWHLDRPGQRWRAVRASGVSSEFLQDIAESPAAAEAPMRIDEPFIAEDVLAAPALAARRDAYARERIRSLLIVPLLVQGRPLARLVFYDRTPRVFSEVDVEAARALANLAAGALTVAELYEESRQANRVKDTFLATLSHELRTPLNAILGYVRMLRGGVLTGEKRKRGLEVVERNAAALAEMVNDVLDVSRVVTGKLRLKVEPVQLSSMMREAIETVQPAADAKAIEVSMTAVGNDVTVKGDADRLRQVFWNLLSNAVKFTPANGRVEIKVVRQASAAEVIVTDNGIGISPDFLPHVFEPFRQAESSTMREIGGLGLGLAITRHIIEMHGGTIRAASEGAGRGTTIRVTLPTH
jgi:PAS domain S-box-containing protein